MICRQRRQIVGEPGMESVSAARQTTQSAGKRLVQASFVCQSLRTATLHLVIRCHPKKFRRPPRLVPSLPPKGLAASEEAAPIATKRLSVGRWRYPRSHPRPASSARRTARQRQRRRGGRDGRLYRPTAAQKSRCWPTESR